MKVTKEELEIIDRVVELHYKKYKVPGYESEDIKQEAYILALKCLNSWDKDKGEFENFLNHYLFCRLKNLVRDMQYNSSKYFETHKLVMTAFDITELSVDEQDSLIDDDNVIQNIETDELVKMIDRYLPIALRKDYLMMRAGLKINRGREKR